jgi:hypothetical protein
MIPSTRTCTAGRSASGRLCGKPGESIRGCRSVAPCLVILATCSSRHVEPRRVRCPRRFSAASDSPQRVAALAHKASLIQHCLLARVRLDVHPVGAKPIAELDVCPPAHRWYVCGSSRRASVRRCLPLPLAHCRHDVQHQAPGSRTGVQRFKPTSPGQSRGAPTVPAVPAHP